LIELICVTVKSRDDKTLHSAAGSGIVC